VSTAMKRVAPMIALSAALHGGGWAAVAQVRPAPPRERIEIEVVRRPRPAPVAPAIPPPAPERLRPALRAMVAAARPAAPVPADAPRPPPALPSTREPPAPVGSAPARALPKVGISLGSTVASGGLAVGAGNTAYGSADEVAAEPSSVRRYAGGVVPAARLSAQPQPLQVPKIEYPQDARKAGIEGQVALVLRIDSRGTVVAVKVVDAPSPSLAAAAAEGARRFRFSPAFVEGEPVETEIRFTYTFLLE
jgi:protein TonB